MATIVEFCLSAADTVLGETFECVPSLSGELEQVAIADRPRIWFQGADPSEIEDALLADSSVTAFSRIMDKDDEHLYSLELVETFDDLLSELIDEEWTVLTASASNGQWFVRMRFQDRNAVRRIYEHLTDRGITVDVISLHPLAEETLGTVGLTSQQYETLVTAIKHGYFDIPRQISQQELADELDISHQALSERLRRAYKTLIAAELNATPDEDDPSVTE